MYFLNGKRVNKFDLILEILNEIIMEDILKNVNVEILNEIIMEDILKDINFDILEKNKGMILITMPLQVYSYKD